MIDMLAPSAKPTTIIQAVTPDDKAFFIKGKKLPSKIPKISGKIDPMIGPIEIEAKPAELKTIIVTVGPTLKEVIATAPLSESSPYSETIPE